MRVLMISKALVVGAYQRKAEELARLPDMELTVAVPPYWRQEGHNMPLERAYMQGYRLVTLPMVFNGHYHVHFYRGLRMLVERLRPDVLHIDEEQYNAATFQAMRLAATRQIPALFFTWQNIDKQYPPLFAWMERYNLRHAAYALTGNGEAAAIIRRKGYQGPIAVIPQFGVDPVLFAPHPQLDHGHPQPEGRQDRQDGFTIGFVCGAGRLTPAKGLHVLIEALAGLDGAWRLDVVGTGESQEDCAQLARRLGIGNRVTFLGQRPSTEVPNVMRGFDLLVGPSLTMPRWKEQFGRMLVEAMACGVPVIGSSSGEIPNVIDDAGIVVPEHDSMALRAAIKRLRDDADERARLAVKGRTRVLELYTQEAIARRTYEVYREMQSSRRLE